MHPENENMFMTFQEYDLDSECGGDRGGGGGGTGLRSSIAMEILGLQREQQVYFSNQEYYRRLEDLKSTHLRNMAELERMYISQGNKRCMEGDDGRLGRKNSTDGQSVRLGRIFFKCTFHCLNKSNTVRNMSCLDLTMMLHILEGWAH